MTEILLNKYYACDPLQADELPSQLFLKRVSEREIKGGERLCAVCLCGGPSKGKILFV